MYLSMKKTTCIENLFNLFLYFEFKGPRDNPEIETEISEVLLTVSSINV